MRERKEAGTSTEYAKPKPEIFPGPLKVASPEVGHAICRAMRLKDYARGLGDIAILRTYLSEFCTTPVAGREMARL